MTSAAASFPDPSASDHSASDHSAPDPSVPRSLRPPWVGALARLPVALLPVGLLVHVGVQVAALLPAALAVSCALVGLGLGAPVAGAATERMGERAVLLLGAAGHVVVMLVLFTAVDRLADAHAAAGAAVADQPAGLLLLTGLLALLAGISCPAVPALARARRWRDHAAGVGVPVGAALRREAVRDEAALVLAPVLVGLLAPMVGSMVGLLAGVLVTALVVPLQATDPRAVPVGRAPAELVDPLRIPLPAVEHSQQMLLAARGLAPESRGAPTTPTRAVTSSGSWFLRLPRLLAGSAGLGLVLGGLWITLLAGSGIASPRPGAAWGAAAATAAAVLTAHRLPGSWMRLAAADRRRLALLVLLGGVAGLAVVQLLAALLADLAPRLLAILHGPAHLVLAAVIGAAAGVLIVELHRRAVPLAPAPLMVTLLSLLQAGLLAGMVAGLLLGGLLGDLIAAIGASWGPVVTVVPVLLGAAAAAGVLRGSDQS